MSDNGWIGVDLDGTLAEYHGWIGESHIGLPIEPMARRVRQWLKDGRDIRIFTARIHQRPQMEQIVQDWTLIHFGVRLPVTCCKDYSMTELWDDRAIQVIKNTGLRADGQA